jgi:predicted transcriptional regulator
VIVLEEAVKADSRKRRDSLQIIADMLTIASNKTLKTKIMYGANLSFAQLNQYLQFLLECNLIRSTKQSNTQAFKATTKGRKFLQDYAKIRELLRTEQERDAENNSPNYYRDGNCYKTRK